MSTSTPSSTIRLPSPPADQRRLLEAGGVACWSEPLTIDTYEPAEPDRYPLFLDRRVYQGSSGKVYPIPFTDRISPEKTARVWQAIHLENEWVRLVLLPELGGRIHIGYDKTRDYDFFYRNNVIKPALVGLAGPWISGGVEFNWPQHHRPATFLPVDSRIERRSDGDVTVWHSDIDPLQRMKGSHGIRLRGDSSLIEATARLHNRTDEPQTFLWWANVAARSHDRYQSFFPTDVTHVADHARRAVTAFPRADSPYYGVDYPALATAENPDADRIDFYGNIPVPTSYMIVGTQDDFFGGYDHDAGAGFVHWADHSIAPGKKMWTWGDGPVGHAWDRHLTDGDGPYVELMAGVFTDNQPDFSYLTPGETRTFSQFWYPIQDVGTVQQATTDAAVSVRATSNESRTVTVGVVTTAVREDASVRLLAGDAVVAEWTVSIAPGSPFTTVADLPDGIGPDDLTLDVLSGEHRLVRLAPRSGASAPVEPPTATEPPAPGNIASADELYLTGVHLMQYRHPTRDARPYFDEVLRRDPLDSRANVAVGSLLYRCGDYPAAIAAFERALERLTARNAHPADAEAAYRLGLVLERVGRIDEAWERFAKAAWDGKWAHASHVAVARLEARAGRHAACLERTDLALRFDSDGLGARNLAVLALRRLGRTAEADARLADTLALDPSDPVAQHLAGRFDQIDPKTRLVVAGELARAGETDAAIELAASLSTTTPGAQGNPVPVSHYLRARWLDELGNAPAADAARQAARTADQLYAFPYGLDELDALLSAIRADESDATAQGLVGTWLLDAGRTADAVAHLTRATVLGSTDPVAWRNAAVATVNTGGDLDEADAFFARALELSPSDPRLIVERDQLARLRGVPPEDRRAAIEAHGTAPLVRDDLAVAYANLLVDTGDPRDALDLLLSRPFQPFEGGEGQVIAAYDRATLALARTGLAAGEPVADLLRSGIDAPESLGEGRHPADCLAERYLLLGDALQAAGDTAGARSAWASARADRAPLAVGVPVTAADYWRGVAHLRLGEIDEAHDVWAALDVAADEQERSGNTIDYFATSLPELLLFDVTSTAENDRVVAELRRLAAAGRSATEGRAA